MCDLVGDVFHFRIAQWSERAGHAGAEGHDGLPMGTHFKATLAGLLLVDDHGKIWVGRLQELLKLRSSEKRNDKKEKQSKEEEEGEEEMSMPTSIQSSIHFISL